MSQSVSAFGTAGIPLDVLDAAIVELEDNADLQWIIGEPVSSGFLLVAEGALVRFALAEDVTLIARDAERVVAALAAALTDEPDRLGRIARTASARRQSLVSLERASFPLDRMHALIAQIGDSPILSARLGFFHIGALVIAAHDGTLDLQLAQSSPLEERARRDVARCLLRLVAQTDEAPVPTQ